MGKIGFVTPWHGENIPGGAEAALRSITDQLKNIIDIEILTTCVEKFSSDWNKNYYKPGEYMVNGVKTIRFPVRKRNTDAFDKINKKLINNEYVNKKEQAVFLKEMINSPKMYKYMERHKDDYDLFVFIPYMFGTTYYGARICYEKAIHIPCAHEEPYIHMDIFKDMFEKSKGMIYNSFPERRLVDGLFDMKSVCECVAGLGLNTNIEAKKERFRERYRIKDPYILYAGRKDVGKNVDVLVKYFSLYKRRNRNDLHLVMIGGGDIDVSPEIKDYVHDLGFVSMQDKYDAYAGAECLCQPSTHESFSYVIMESWLCGRPVLVHGECPVTRNFVIESNGGLYFESYFEFEGCLNYYIHNKKIASILGGNGKKFVVSNFSWDIVLEKYKMMFKECRKGIGD